jgi:AraC-like DNA-binding protein
MDQLSKALAETRLRGSLLATLDFAAPWAVDFETAPFGAPTHYIASGKVRLEAAGCEPTELHAGDLVMFPRWNSHVLRSIAGNPTPRKIRDVVRANEGASWLPGEWLDHPLHLTLSGDGDRTMILSLVFELAETSPHPLLEGLPSMICFRADDHEMAGLMKTTLAFLSAESSQRREGYALVSSRLAELLFMQIVRAQVTARPGEIAGWLRGLIDPAIGASLAAIADDPGAPWTLDAMARVSGLSRSGFCARFRELMDVTPHHHLITVRMQTAADRLAAGARVKTVAAEMGYSTPYAFASAFKRRYGLPPAQYARSRR